MIGSSLYSGLPLAVSPAPPEGTVVVWKAAIQH